MNHPCCSWFSIQALTRRRPLDSGGGQNKKKKNDSVGDENDLLLLHRRLTATDLVFYGVGCSVGAGIYSLIGIGARTAGPAIAGSFCLAGMACCFTSLAYAEFASRLHNTAGSAYTFCYVAFGELCGWLVGWNLTLGYAVSAAVVARSWAEYVTGFVSGLVGTSGNSNDCCALDRYLTKVPIPFLNSGGDNNTEYYTCCPLAMVIIALSTLVLVTGVKESARFNTIMTLLNLSVLLIVLLFGLGQVQWHDNLTPVFPHGVAGMARGAGLVFFSYLGFDMVSCLSEEVQDAKRNMPIGIIGSLAVSMTIYISIAVVVVGMTPVALLGNDVPIVNALLANACCTPGQQQEQSLGFHVSSTSSTSTTTSCLSYACQPILHPLLYVASRIVSFGAIFGLTTATFTCLMGQPRIFYSMSKDGLLFPIYARVNPHTGVPTTGTIITGVLTAMVACLVDLECLANAISLGTLQVFTFVNAGVILLRVQDEDSRPPAPSPSSSSSSSTLRQPVHVTSYGDGNNSERDCLVVVQEPENADHNDEPIHPTRPVTDPGAAAAVTRSLGLIDETSTQISLRWTSGWSFLQQRQRRQSSSSLGIIRDKPIWLMLLFTTSAILASATIANNSSSDDVSDHDAWFFRDFGIGLFCILIMLACTVALWSLPHKSPPPSDTFACPMVPAVPLLGIVCNSYMMGSMSRNTWCIIATWLVLGLLFYFCYGIHHSELRHVDDIIHHHRQHEDDDENKDKNSTTNNKPDDKDNHDFVEWSEESSSSTKTRLLPGGNPKENYRGVDDDTTTTGL